MQPGMQACVVSPPRARFRSRMNSPPSLNGPSELSVRRPDVKLRVGMPPMVLVKSPTMAVPRLAKASIALSAPSILPYSRTEPISALRSWKVGILSLSTTMALTFLEPITAPTPPRAEIRVGRPSVSVKEMPDIRPRYSPTGLQMPRLTLSPYFANSISAHSMLPLPR